MTVILVLFTCIMFLLVDYFKTAYEVRQARPRGTLFTTPGFEMLGALAQDGGAPVEKKVLATKPPAKQSEVAG